MIGAHWAHTRPRDLTELCLVFEVQRAPAHVAEAGHMGYNWPRDFWQGQIRE
jgi:hypothetical protein